MYLILIIIIIIYLYIYNYIVVRVLSLIIIIIIIHVLFYCVWDFLVGGVHLYVYPIGPPAYIHCMQHTLIPVPIGDGGSSLSVQKVGGRLA